ncbi:histone methyltransferase set2 [Haplosporangium sp. Z 767]|nr:histone methyltransferase set2 [Haplosporangium sp. Z 767]
MLPGLPKDDTVLESGRVTQHVASGSADSSVGPSSASTSTSTSPSSSISDAMMTIEHAKETGFSSIIPELKQEEPEICASLESLNTPFSDSEASKAIKVSGSPSATAITSPKIEKMEKLEITSPIPLSRLFDFDKDDKKSDQIVLNESERQYQKKLRDEFDAGFQDIKNHSDGGQDRNGDRPLDQVGGYANGHGNHRRPYDSDDEEIRVDDDDEDDTQGERSFNGKHSIPPPPPPPIGPPSIKHLPSAIELAQSTYQQIEHNIYRGTNTGNSPVDDCLPCQCKYNPHRDPRWKACGPDCINRNLLVECIEDDCPCGSYCLNRRFQMKQNADVDVVKTEKKGFGLRAMEGLAPGTFVMEYIGEVLPHTSFVKRTREYSLAGVEHFYFMSLQSDEVIDATKKGCLARFINHSCNPNCHLEKWVVGSKLRIGIFTIKRVAEGEELTFDYQFERYGAEAQKCYCGEPNCTGFIGGNKRSSATRLDNYNNLDEVEDEDEIDLENQISLRHPKKEKGNDGDYEDTYEERKFARGIEDPILMEKLARIMFMKPKVQKSKRLLAKLMATAERACLRRFLVLHGLVILKAWLKHYKDEPDIIMGIMFVLPNIPLLSRNAIEDSQIEEAVQEVADGPECPSKGMAQAVLAQWKELKPTYRIPKAKKPAVTVAADVVSTPGEEPSSFMSPADSNGSGSAEGLGKRQYDEEERASTPAGMEKRGKFENHVGQTPVDENDTSETPSDPSSRYQGYTYDSPEYTSRGDGRMGDGYGREGRDGGYGRADMYGRMEPHREGSYGRGGEHGYSRPESYGRIDPYGMSKSGYERSRYEHYRSERDRERDRYYDYYREREYDRDYRNHRDHRDMRDMKDERYRDYRDPRDYRDHRDSYSHAPPSPRHRDRDLSPGGYAHDRSPSSSSRQGSWTDEVSRSGTPAKDGASLPVESSQPGQMVQPITHTTDVSDPKAPTASVGNPSAIVADDPTLRSPSVNASVTDGPSAPLGSTPLRNYSLPSDQPATNDQSGAAAATTAVPTTSSSSYHPNGYPYRSSSSSHSEYAHSRYSSYHHSQYYRHSSSNYPHYSKSHHYRSTSSRAYPSPSNYPPPVELPPNWSKASDPEGRIYYYNEITRATQWDPPKMDPAPTAPSEPIPQAPASHYQQPHSYHASLPHLPPHALRPASPEPPKPVNIDGFTQEQLQEVIGRAYDKQKQKNLANGIGSAGASVHDVDSPSTRTGIMHSPSTRPSSGKPLKAMNEKDLKAAISATVVKNMAKYKIKLGSSEAFKKHARRITHLIADKEMRSKSFKSGEMTEVTSVMKNKIRRFVKDYMTKLFKKQPKEERSSLSASTAALVNGSKTSISHVIVLGADGTSVPTPGSGSGSATTMFKGNDQPPSSSSSSVPSGKKDKKSMGYGDVEVDDDDDVKYGEGEDGDEDEGDLDGDEDDDEGGVAAVPSTSVELPL